MTPSPLAARRPGRQRLPHLLGLVCLLAAPYAGAQISLGTATSFGVLGASTVTNTGPTVVSGDLGVSPGTSITGFPPGQVNLPGVQHVADATALGAQTDANAAYVAITNTVIPAPVDLTGTDLGGLTLPPGHYNFASSAQLTGTLTLDAQGNPDAVWLFSTGSALTTASGSAVAIINGGSSCNLYWRLGSSATLGTTTRFQGNLLALASITLNTRATLGGRALALTGAVTLNNNVVAACGTAGPPVLPPPAPVVTGAEAIPTLSTWALLLLSSLLGLGFVVQTRRSRYRN